MAIKKLRVSDEVLDRLGSPTVESLRTRLSHQATCPDCGSPLGKKSVAVIGQQSGDRAVLFGAHSACRSSQWLHADELGELKLPYGLAVHGAAIGMGFRGPPPRGLWWLQRWIPGLSPITPALVVFPEPEWAWVRLVGPGETINDDLTYYRETFGLTGDPHGNVPRAQGRAWLDHEGQMIAEVDSHRFVGPINSATAATARKIGAVQLILTSGIGIGPDGTVQVKDFLRDLYAAAMEGRTACGWLPLVAEPQ